jgi:hypothetical protein
MTRGLQHRSLFNGFRSLTMYDPEVSSGASLRDASRYATLSSVFVLAARLAFDLRKTIF